MTPTQPKVFQQMVLPMGSEFVATVTFYGEITKRRLRKVIANLELTMDEYPEDDPPQPTRTAGGEK